MVNGNHCKGKAKPSGRCTSGTTFLIGWLTKATLTKEHQENKYLKKMREQILGSLGEEKTSRK